MGQVCSLRHLATASPRSLLAPMERADYLAPKAVLVPSRSAAEKTASLAFAKMLCGPMKRVAHVHKPSSVVGMPTHFMEPR